MTSIPKTAYLDGVAFAINPIFILDIPRDKDKRFADYELTLALNYDLSKAKSLANCKYEFEAEKVLLEKKQRHHHRRNSERGVDVGVEEGEVKEEEDEKEDDRRREKRHSKHKKHKQRVKKEETTTRMDLNDEMVVNGDDYHRDHQSPSSDMTNMMVIDRLPTSSSSITMIKNHSASSLTSRSRKQQQQQLFSTMARSNRSMSSHNVFHLGEDDEEDKMISSPSNSAHYGAHSNVLTANTTSTSIASSFPSYSYPIETTSLINTAVVGDLMANYKRNKWLLYMNEFQPTSTTTSHPIPPHFAQTPQSSSIISTGNTSSVATTIQQQPFFLPSPQPPQQQQQQLVAPTPTPPPTSLLSSKSVPAPPPSQLPTSQPPQPPSSSTSSALTPHTQQQQQQSTSLNNTNTNTNTNSYFFLNHPFNMSVSSLLEPTVNKQTSKQTVAPSKDDINNNIASTAPVSLSSSLSSNIYPTPLLSNTTSSINQKSTWTNTNNTNSNNNNKKYSQLLGEILGDSLDPFHDMELKTINDYEELKNILTNHQPAAVVVETPPPPPPPQPQSQPLQQQQQTVVTNTYNPMRQNQPFTTTTTVSRSVDAVPPITTSSMIMDNFGLPKISFVDFDIKK